MESIVFLLYIIATNFGWKKSENLEEGESVNDLKLCETICKRISLCEIFLFPKPSKFPKMSHQNDSCKMYEFPCKATTEK